MAQERTKFVEAQAKLAEEQNRRTALKVRKAELAIEYFDWRMLSEPPAVS